MSIFYSSYVFFLIFQLSCCYIQIKFQEGKQKQKSQQVKEQAIEKKQISEKKQEEGIISKNKQIQKKGSRLINGNQQKSLPIDNFQGQNFQEKNIQDKNIQKKEEKKRNFEKQINKLKNSNKAELAKKQQNHKEKKNSKRQKNSKKQTNEGGKKKQLDDTIQYANLTCSPELLQPIQEQSSEDNNNNNQNGTKLTKKHNKDSKVSGHLHNKTQILQTQPTVFQRKLNKNNLRGKKRINQGAFDREEYQRAPILSYIYGDLKTDIEEKRFSNCGILNETRQRCMIEVDGDFTSIVKVNRKGQHNIKLVDKVIGILISIDPWLINRIFEPYLSPISAQKGQSNGLYTEAWLYCKGKWKLFQSEECVSISSFLSDTLRQAITQHYPLPQQTDQQKIFEHIGIEELLRMITGLRVMQLKNKKKLLLSQQLIYNLKRGYIIKGISHSTGQRKDKNKTYEILDVKKVENQQRLIQVKVDDLLERRMDESQGEDQNRHKEDQDNIMWIKEANLYKYFDYFLLICYRDESLWTSKALMKTVRKEGSTHTHVFTLDSLHPQNTIGSLQIHQHPFSNGEPMQCHMALYRQIKPKVLKFIGKIDEKYKPSRCRQNPNPSTYFDFSIKGRYYLFLTVRHHEGANEDGVYLSLEASNTVDITFLEKIENKTRKNDTSQYVQYKSDAKLSKQSSFFKSNEDWRGNSSVKEQFIDYLVGQTRRDNING